MYIPNDIDNLLHLAKHLKIHEALPAGGLVVSKMRVQIQGVAEKIQLASYHQITQLNVDDLDMFTEWCADKLDILDEEDLSTIYIATKRPEYTVLLCDDDLFLPGVCDDCKVRYKTWDDLYREIADERTMKYYELIRRA